MMVASTQRGLKNRTLEGYSGKYLTMRYEYRHHAPAPKNPNRLGLVFRVYYAGKSRGEVTVYTEVAKDSIKGGNKKGRNPQFALIEQRGIWRTLDQNELMPTDPPSRHWRSFDKVMKSTEWVAQVKSKRLDSTTVYTASTLNLWSVGQAPAEYNEQAYRQMCVWFHGYDPHASAVAPAESVDLESVPF